MKLRQNEFIIGLSVTIATLIVIFSILWLGKSNFLVKGIHLNMLVENAAGAGVGDEVLYRGLPVGTVQDARIVPEGILLKLKIEKIKTIPRDSRFIIKSISLLGEMAVEIVPGTSSQYLAFGDTVRGVAAGSLLDMVGSSKNYQEQLRQIFRNLDSLFSDQTSRNLNQLLRAWQRTAANLNRLLQGDLQETLANAREISSQNKQAIHTLLDSLASNTRELSQGLKNFNRASVELNRTLSHLNQGKGTLGKLMVEDSLYLNLNRSIQHLDSLILDIKKHPERYFKVKVL